MNDESNPGNESQAQVSNTETTQPDPIQNVKAEMNRKFDNLTNELRSIASKLSTPPQQTQTQPQKKKLADLAITDEDAFERELETRVAEKASTIISQHQTAQAKQQAVIGSLVAEFPELSSADHDLTKRAVEIHNTLSDEERANPAVAYKLAVQNAAIELGIRPKSKRTQSSEDFSLGSSSGPRPGRKPAGSDIDPNTEAFAQMLGLNTSDPKVKERLKARSKRQYGKWE